MDFNSDNRAYVHAFIDSLIDTKAELELSTYTLIDKCHKEDESLDSQETNEESRL
jgi:hypothetical protein